MDKAKRFQVAQDGVLAVLRQMQVADDYDDTIESFAMLFQATCDLFKAYGGSAAASLRMVEIPPLGVKNGLEVYQEFAWSLDDPLLIESLYRIGEECTKEENAFQEVDPEGD